MIKIVKHTEPTPKQLGLSFWVTDGLITQINENVKLILSIKQNNKNQMALTCVDTIHETSDSIPPKQNKQSGINYFYRFL